MYQFKNDINFASTSAAPVIQLQVKTKDLYKKGNISSKLRDKELHPANSDYNYHSDSDINTIRRMSLPNYNGVLKRLSEYYDNEDECHSAIESPIFHSRIINRCPYSINSIGLDSGTDKSNVSTPSSIRLKWKRSCRSHANRVKSVDDVDIFATPSSPISSNDDLYYITSIVLIQSIVRRWLVRNNIKKTERDRMTDRNTYQYQLTSEYNATMLKIETEIKAGKKCPELEEAKTTFAEYTKQILSQPKIAEEDKVRLRYLFSLCDKDQKGGLTKKEFLVLVNQIFKLVTPDFSYSILFPLDDGVTSFNSFYNWFKRIIKYFFIDRESVGAYLSTGIKGKLSRMFVPNEMYPYMYIIIYIL